MVRLLGERLAKITIDSPIEAVAAHTAVVELSRGERRSSCLIDALMVVNDAGQAD